MDRRKLLKNIGLATFAAAMPHSLRAQAQPHQKTAAMAGAANLYVLFFGSWLFIDNGSVISALTPYVCDHHYLVGGDPSTMHEYDPGNYTLKGISGQLATKISAPPAEHFLINRQLTINYAAPALRRITLPAPNAIYPSNAVQSNNVVFSGKDAQIIKSPFTYSSRYVFEYNNVTKDNIDIPGLDILLNTQDSSNYILKFFTGPFPIAADQDLHSIAAFNAMICLTDLQLRLEYTPPAATQAKAAHVDCFDQNNNRCVRTINNKHEDCMIPVPNISPADLQIGQCEQNKPFTKLSPFDGPQLACDSPAAFVCSSCS